VIPYFRVRGAAAADIEASFETHAALTGVRLIDSVEEEYLMRAGWEREYVGILSALSEARLVVLSGVGTSDGWRFEVRGESQSDIGEFRTYCQDHDIPIDITAVHALLPVRGEGYELTDTSARRPSWPTSAETSTRRAGPRSRRSPRNSASPSSRSPPGSSAGTGDSSARRSSGSDPAVPSYLYHLYSQ